MFEETRKYTEEIYVSKEELAQRLELTGVVLDAVWKQVEDYRALLRRSFCFDDLHADIVMTRALCAKLQQTTELLYRCPLQRPFSAAVQKSVLLAGNYPHWLYKVGELLALAPLPHGLVTFLEQEEEPLLLRIFFLSMFTGERAYLDCLLVHERCHAPFALAMEEQPNRTAAGDLSVRFLAFLDDIRLQISRSMLSLTETDVTACQTMQLQELLEQYPMLSEQQLMFYVDHRTAIPLLHHTAVYGICRRV
ncbi:MAG: hypothetical protein ACLTDX_19105 [[Clostridium] innocuum]